MPGMNKSSRTISLIQSMLVRLESGGASTALDALGVLDEIRRLERKWRGQVAEGSPRRIGADFREMGGWYRRWLAASRRILEREDAPQLRAECTRVDDELKTWSSPI